MMETQGLLVRGWQMNHGMGFAILTLGVDAQGPDGQSGIRPSPNYLLSAEYCRQLAEMLVQVAGTLESQTGSA